MNYHNVYSCNRATFQRNQHMTTHDDTGYVTSDMKERSVSDKNDNSIVLSHMKLTADGFRAEYCFKHSQNIMMSTDTQSWTVTEIHLFHRRWVMWPACTAPRQLSSLWRRTRLSLTLTWFRVVHEQDGERSTCYLSSFKCLRGRGRSPTRVCARNCFVWTDESLSRHPLQSNSDSGSQISSLPLINIKIILHTHCPWLHFFFVAFFFFFFLFNPLNKTKRKAKYQKHHIGLTNCNITS